MNSIFEGMMSGTRTRRATLVLMLLAGLAAGVSASAPAFAQDTAKKAPATQPVARLAGVKTWAYQLQNLDLTLLARSPYDLIVMDYTRNGDDRLRFKTREITKLKRKPDGGRRLVLAYMSIGEAEDYRFYWDDKWVELATPSEPPAAPSAGAEGGQQQAGDGVPAQTAQQPSAAASPSPTAPSSKASGRAERWITKDAPPWLGDESARWGGNFEVKFWDPGWQAIIFGTPQSYLEQVIEAGFDGVYLDRVDAHYEFQHERDAGQEMADFVIRLAAHARTLNPDFVVVPQNGEELLLKPEYVAAIDAIAKEDLLFGNSSDGEPNNPLVIDNSLRWLANATRGGRPVLVVEYLEKPEVVAEAYARLVVGGFVPYFGPRDLDRLALPFWDKAGERAKPKR